jgi:hypothetical protein
MRQRSPMPVTRTGGSTSSLEVDFALVLWNSIESAKKDSAQLRHIVFELARLSLEREVRKQEDDGSPSVNDCETPRLMLAFEAAIGHVERFSRQQEKLTFPPADLRSSHGCDCPADADMNSVSHLSHIKHVSQTRRTPHTSRMSSMSPCGARVRPRQGSSNRL